MVLVSLTIGHPRIAISQTNNSWKGKVNENLVCLICPNITIKAKYNKCLIRGGGVESIINALSPTFHSQKNCIQYILIEVMDHSLKMI